MRFLLLTQYYPPEVGAAQVRLEAVVREVRRAGHQIEVVTALPNYPSGALAPADRGRLRRVEHRSGIRITRMWLLPATGTGIRRLISYASFTLTCLLGALQVRRPHVVLVESPPLFLGVAGWLTARRFGAHLVLNISDLWPDSVRDMDVMSIGPWLRLAETLERWLYTKASAITAVTNGVRDRLVQGKGVPDGRVLFLPNGVDTRLFRPNVAPPTATPTVMYIGTHGLAHSLDTLLDAAALTPEIRYVLIGDGSDKPRLLRSAARRSLGNVEFRDPIDPEDVAAAYGEAIAGVSTLRDSPFMEGVRPAKVPPIMACGLPVIYVGAGEGADIIRESNAGIVVAPGDAAGLASAARAIVADPTRATVMGMNGRRFVERHLTWERLVGAWLSELHVVLATDQR